MLQLTALIGAVLLSGATQDSGVVLVESSHSVDVTADRIESMLEERGLRLFARIDHAANALQVDAVLGPTQLLIFGSPRIGTRLIQCGRSIGIDLPQKYLIFRDDEGRVWVGYNDPAYLARRHGLEGCDELLVRVGNVLAEMARQAAAG
jgi:uncharacterized protein (DUF302 family)